MPQSFLNDIAQTLSDISDADLYKVEREIGSAQGGEIAVAGRKVINLCANNYLGLADNAALISAAKDALDRYGYGMASVRFICGTQDMHRDLEGALARFLRQDDAILYAACFDANGGLFEPLLGPEDAIVSDSLNHASIIDGIRLCKARRYRYANNDLSDLEDKLKAARSDGARNVMIATDGVFSMDGYLADLPGLRKLADTYDAVLMVDDCHATGFMGPRGAGTPDHFDTKVDIVTGTLGKALGGSIGGYVAGPQAVIDLLRQRSRPYLFSNSLPPAMVAGAIAALQLIENGADLRARLFENTRYWREGLTQIGFRLLAGEHPIVPVMLGDAKIAQFMARALFDEGVYVTGFFYPVVPNGQARIRTQMNAALNKAQLDFALDAFARVGHQLGVLK